MSRMRVSEMLHEICDNVYFQPPESKKLTYPCIIYEMRSGETDYADDLPYRYTKSYTVTVIDKNPDTTIPDKVAMLPMCRMDRFFTSDNLNHYTFVLYNPFLSESEDA